VITEINERKEKVHLVVPYYATVMYILSFVFLKSNVEDIRPTWNDIKHSLISVCS
jgi:hypothetical protein